MTEEILQYLTDEEAEFYLSLTPRQIANYIAALYKIRSPQAQYSHALAACTGEIKSLIIQAAQESTNCIVSQIRDGATRPPVAAPASLGKIAENDFETLCGRLPAEFSVQCTATLGKRGDFIISYKSEGRTIRCLVDVKNYTSNVPRSEVDKFVRDLQSHYDCGLLYSTRTAISGYPQCINRVSFATHTAHTPVWIVHGISAEILLEVIQLACQTTSAAPSTYDSEAIAAINDSLTHSADTRRMLTELSATHSNTIQQIIANLNAMEIKIRHNLRTLITPNSEVEKPLSHPLTQPLVQLDIGPPESWSVIRTLHGDYTFAKIKKLAPTCTEDELAAYCTTYSVVREKKNKTLHYIFP